MSSTAQTPPAGDAPAPAADPSSGKPAKRRAGRPRRKPEDGPGPYARHGLDALKKRTKTDGVQTIDRRSAAAKRIKEFIDEITAELGGRDNLSAQKRTLIDLAARDKLLLDHADAWIIENAYVVDTTEKQLYRIVQQRQDLSRHLMELLSKLGLDRVAHRVPSAPDPVRELEKKYGGDEGDERRTPEHPGATS